jgi:hypothetical protein
MEVNKIMRMNYESGAFWSEPGRVYIVDAMAQLGLEDADLEEVRPEHRLMNLPIGEYPVLDRVYRRAWRLRETS